jgi:HlyD family secretion protein
MLQKTPETAAPVLGSSPESEVAAVLSGGRKSGRRRRLWTIAAVVVVALAGLATWLMSGSGGPSLAYTTQPVIQGDLIVTVTATGTVEPTNEVTISSERSGTVASVLVDYNDTVKTGQTLARLDTETLNANLALEQATLAARKADVAEAQATVVEKEIALKRAGDLVARNVSSQETLDGAKANSDRAKAALQSAQANEKIAEANLSIAESNLAKAEIVSPINGVVLSRDVEPGQIVASSLSAPTLFTLAEDLKKMQLEVGIDEADMGKVKHGDKATFTVEAYPGKSFPAAIAQVRYSPETVEGVVTYTAVLTVDNSDLLLRPGMTATADITVETIKDAIQVPNAALRWSPPAETARGGSSRGAGLLGLLMPRGGPGGNQPPPTAAINGRAKIWVLRDGAAVAVPVTIGSSDGVHTAVTGALTVNDKVIVGSRTQS